MLKKHTMFHLISVALVPAAAFAVNLGVLWTSSDNSQYSSYLLYVQWSSFVGSILGLNLVELKTSIAARNADLGSFLDFLYIFNISIILVFIPFAEGDYLSVSLIAITSASVALYNSFNSFLIFRMEVAGVFIQRISRFFLLFTFFPLIAILGTGAKEWVLYYTYTMSFLLPALLFLKCVKINKLHDSIIYTLRFLWLHKTLVCIRALSFIVDMAHFPIMALSINNLSRVRDDDSWFYFLSFFGIALPLVTVFKQFIGERFRILLMTNKFRFSEFVMVRFAIILGFLFVCSGCVGFVFSRSIGGIDGIDLSTLFLGGVFFGVFVLSLASGITSVMLQHLSLHGFDLLFNLSTFFLTVLAYLFGGVVGLELVDVVLVLAVSLAVKYLGHSSTVLYFNEKKLSENESY
jgi:preprotein translocase subunit Sss1